MTWVEMPGIPGKVWQPEWDPKEKRKHNCRDCYNCQLCSDARCERCLTRKAHLAQKKKK